MLYIHILRYCVRSSIRKTLSTYYNSTTNYWDNCQGITLYILAIRNILRKTFIEYSGNSTLLRASGSHQVVMRPRFTRYFKGVPLFNFSGIFSIYNRLSHTCGYNFIASSLSLMMSSSMSSQTSQCVTERSNTISQCVY